MSDSSSGVVGLRTKMVAMLDKDEVALLVNAGSKMAEVDSITKRTEYPVYELSDMQQVNDLINAMACQRAEDVNTVKNLVSQETWTLSEVFALNEGNYDPRNFGKVVARFKKEKDIRPRYSREELMSEDFEELQAA